MATRGLSGLSAGPICCCLPRTRGCPGTRAEEGPEPFSGRNGSVWVLLESSEWLSVSAAA